ncbi:hypothetical protein QJQ45_022769 [Haematococcus lacustris]|nr:hypothetical protein QJQ45_022769 [Haematococcus lacustris]
MSPHACLPQLSHRMMLDVYQGVFTAVVERVETQPFVAMSVDGWSKDLGSAHCLAWCAAWWGQAYLVDCVNTEANSVTAAYLLSKFEETMTKHNLPDVVLFSRTSLSAVYFAPQLTTDPVRWWRLHGDFAPELQTVAQRVLCIPATAAANERVFSAFSHVWSDKRASLILGRMWVMAYIYFNKRVLERKPKTLSHADWEEYEMWMRKTPQDQS